MVPERCISCGNCTMVCSQMRRPTERHRGRSLACSIRRCRAALLGPFVPGWVRPCRPAQVIGALRDRGFTYVIEVAYGADLVNQACHDYLWRHPPASTSRAPVRQWSSTCSKYHPELTDRIMPIVSPMVATALAVKEAYGQDVRCVFVGPCVAKKAEILDNRRWEVPSTRCSPWPRSSDVRRPGHRPRPEPRQRLRSAVRGQGPYLPDSRRPARKRRASATAYSIRG